MNTQKLVLVLLLVAAFNVVDSLAKPNESAEVKEEDFTEQEGEFTPESDKVVEEKEKEQVSSATKLPEQAHHQQYQHESSGSKYQQPKQPQGILEEIVSRTSDLGSLIGLGPKKVEEKEKKVSEVASLASAGVLGATVASTGAQVGLKEKSVEKAVVLEKEKEKEKIVESKQVQQVDLFGGFSKIGEWSKLIFNPFELAKSICQFFAIPLEKFLKLVGRPLILGTEALLFPLVVSAKIVEKVFAPDQCRLKFVCSMGKHLEFARETVLQFSPNFLEGSSHLKALSEGIIGRDCETIYKGTLDCKPRLTKPFEDLVGLALGKPKAGLSLARAAT